MDFMDKTLLEPLGLQVKDAVEDVLYNYLTNKKKPINDGACGIVFMAGSPAAGKTELINNVILTGKQTNFVRIDADDFRWWFPYYNESNSVCFQKPASKMVSAIYARALDNRYQIIMDSTFASKGIADSNFDAAIAAGYTLILNYVYLDPAIAWVYAQQRSRVVPLDVLKNNFINGRKVIEHVLEKYDGQFALNVFHRYREPANPTGFSIETIRNVTKDTWADSHHCPYTCIDDLADIGV